MKMSKHNRNRSIFGSQHMPLVIPPKIKNSMMLYEQFEKLKYKGRNIEFWCKG